GRKGFEDSPTIAIRRYFLRILSRSCAVVRNALAFTGELPPTPSCNSAAKGTAQKLTGLPPMLDRDPRSRLRYLPILSKAGSDPGRSPRRAAPLPKAADASSTPGE